jgi:hypothetical protein
MGDQNITEHVGRFPPTTWPKALRLGELRASRWSEPWLASDSALRGSAAMMSRDAQIRDLDPRRVVS